MEVRVALTYIVKQIASGKLLYHPQNTAQGSLTTEGWDEGWGGSEAKREEAYVYLRLPW